MKSKAKKAKSGWPSFEQLVEARNIFLSLLQKITDDPKHVGIMWRASGPDIDYADASHPGSFE